MRAHRSLLTATNERRAAPEYRGSPSQQRSLTFAEVACDPDLGTVHVRHIVGAYCGGRILNEKTARSQYWAESSGA